MESCHATTGFPSGPIATAGCSEAPAVVPLMLLIMATILMFQLQSFSRLFLVASVAPLAVIGVDGIPALADGGNVLRPKTSVKLSLRLPPTADGPLVGTSTPMRPESTSATAEIRVRRSAIQGGGGRTVAA